MILQCLPRVEIGPNGLIAQLVVVRDNKVAPGHVRVLTAMGTPLQVSSCGIIHSRYKVMQYNMLSLTAR